MAINAYNKFTNAIFNRLSYYELESTREINDIEELNKIMETATGRGCNIEVIKLVHHFIDANATEYIYSNGLKYLDSKIKYRKIDGKTIHTVRQITITPDYKEYPLINIIIEEDKKAIQQFLVSSNPDDSIIPDEDKTIGFLKSEIQVNGRCGAIFETLTDIKNQSLLLERYKQIYPVSDFENTDTNLLNLCGCGLRYLEIIYHKNQPVFAQLSDEHKVEMANYNPNSSIDAEKIVNTISEEVSAITATINHLFTKHEKKVKNRQRRLKK